MSYDIRFGVKVEGMGGYIATIDEVTYLKLTSKSDNKFDGVKIELNGGFVKTNAGKWASFTPASTAVYNSGSAITKFSLPEGAQAYIITAVTNTTVTANRITVMNAGEGYFIKGESASTNYAVACTTTDADATTGNKVVACLVATTIDGSTPNTNSKFILGTNTENNEAGLFLVNSEITIPASITTVNPTIFNGYTSLKTINVDSANASYSSKDGALYSKDGSKLITVPCGGSPVALPSGLKAINANAIPGGLYGSIVLPQGVTTLENNAIGGCDILFIPDSVTTISKTAFANVTDVVVVQGSTAETFCKGEQHAYFEGEEEVDSIWNNLNRQ